MNIRTANAVLKLLKTAKNGDPRIRVAMRWVQASLESEYDKMLRAQVLEGAAGVREGTWWKNGQRGLDKALAFFSDKGDPVKPEWFSKEYSGMYGILRTTVGKILRKSGVAFEPLDIINNALMGLSLSGGSGQKRPPYEAGKKLSPGIKAGKEHPKSVAAGKLGSYLNRKVLNEAKTIKFNEGIPIGPDGDVMEVADTAAEKREAGDFLLNIILWQRNDALGRKIRDFMRKSWAGTGQEKSMNYWLNTIEQEIRIPGKKEVAEAVGISPQTFIQRHWGKAWKQFIYDLWSNQSLLDQLQKRYEKEGLPWFQERPDPEEVFKKRKRKASDLMVEKVVTRWMDGKTDQEYTRWFSEPASYSEWADGWNSAN